VHLDPDYVAYSRMNGATGDVFRMLDESTRIQLRYEALLQQMHSILNTAA
jgi:hypothetical protein